VVLLTDGEPNLDLRPYCAQAPGDGEEEGVCPYDETDDLAEQLHDAAVTVNVIGFALEEVEFNGETINCNEIDTEALIGASGDGGACAGNLSNNKPLAVCCELSRVAFKGSDGKFKAHFAADSSQLREAIREVLSELAPRVSLTQPAVAGGTSFFSDFAASMRFYSFTRPESFSLWRGELQRERYICNDDNEPVRVDSDENAGDDFAKNLTQSSGNRSIVTVEAEVDSS